MPGRDEYEADLFRRYEARIVALEVDVSAHHEEWKHYKALVDKHETDRMIAQAIADKIVEQRSFALTRRQVAVATVALFLPTTVGALLTFALVHWFGSA